MFSKVALVALAAGAQVSFAAPVTQEQRSIPAILRGATSLLTGDLLNNKRSTSGVMVDTETGTIYMDVPESQDSRSLKAIGTAVAGGIASGVAGAAVKSALDNRSPSLSAIENFLSNLKRSEPSGLMVDTETGVIYADIPDANESRSLKAVGTALVGGAASLITGQILNNKRNSGLMVDTDTGVIYADIPDTDSARSLSAIENVIGSIFNKREEPLDSRSLTAIGNFISGLFNKRDVSELDSRSLSAIENFLSNLKREEHDSRSLTAIGNFISGLFNKRDVSDLDSRSLSAIESFLSNLKRSELEESMSKRAINDLE